MSAELLASKQYFLMLRTELIGKISKNPMHCSENGFVT